MVVRGASPVFVDIRPDDYTIDVDLIEEAVTPKTKAIIPVHLYGQCANMDDIMHIASENSIWVIEDNAQAVGADLLINKQWVKSGTAGHIGCTSFFPSKNLGCFGDGGAICTNLVKEERYDGENQSVETSFAT